MAESILYYKLKIEFRKRLKRDLTEKEEELIQWMAKRQYGTNSKNNCE